MKFKFQKYDSIGSADASEDSKILSQCFVDTGDLKILKDCDNPRRIILGRTGTGKTALISKLEKGKNTIIVNPETLSFNYLTNSTILQFFLDINVNLDLFFKLLWRHVFTIELIKIRYHITDENSKDGFLTRIKALVKKDKKKERAINYLLEWENHFWSESEYRIREITSKVEDQLKSSLGAKYGNVIGSVSGAKSLTEEQKTEVFQRGQNIINTIQMRELVDILDFLKEEIFDYKNMNFYICIDKLDENWIDERFRYILIKNLIETLRDFRKVDTIKIILCLRKDLIDRVFKFTRTSGFQEEKYRDMYLNLNWTKEQLFELLEKRVRYLVKSRTKESNIDLNKILPESVSGKTGFEYILERTFYRPREIIEFFNSCIECAEGKSTISRSILLKAEELYSKKRLRSLQDEWFADFPSLIEFTAILKKKNCQFLLRELEGEHTLNFCYQYCLNNSNRDDELSVEARNIIEKNFSQESFLLKLCNIFYKTSVIGLKPESYSSINWSFENPNHILKSEISLDSKIYIHPTFFRVLGINNKNEA